MKLIDFLTILTALVAPLNTEARDTAALNLAARRGGAPSLPVSENDAIFATSIPISLKLKIGIAKMASFSQFFELNLSPSILRIGVAVNCKIGAARAPR